MQSAGMILVTALLVASPSAAQTTPRLLVAGGRVALRIPAAVIRRDTGANQALNVVAARAGAQVLINGRADWESAGLGLRNSVQVVDLLQDERSVHILVRLNAWEFTIAMPTADTAFIIPRLFAPASDTATVAGSIREAVRRRLFHGAMASVAPSGQAKILDILSFRVPYDAVTTVALDGKPYLTFHEIESTYTCTIGETSNPERQAGAIAEAAFPVLWNLGAADSTMRGEFGFAVTVHMKSNYSCVTEGSPDYVTIYAPADAARRYASGAITGRELLAGSVATFNGNRVKLQLAK